MSIRSDQEAAKKTSILLKVSVEGESCFSEVTRWITINREHKMSKVSRALWRPTLTEVRGRSGKEPSLVLSANSLIANRCGLHAGLR